MVAIQSSYSLYYFNADQPLARFRKAVNKSIEQRRQKLARFREAVEKSLTHHKKRKLYLSSQHHGHADISTPKHSPLRRLSTQIEIAALGGGSMGNASAYFDDLNDMISEDDMEVRIDS